MSPQILEILLSHNAVGYDYEAIRPDIIIYPVNVFSKRYYHTHDKELVCLASPNNWLVFQFQVQYFSFA